SPSRRRSIRVFSKLSFTLDFPAAGSSAHKPVTLAVHRHDIGRPLGVRLELLPKPQDVSVHRPRGGEPLITPDLVEQPLSSQDFSTVLHQVAEEVELLASEPHLPARLEGLTRA